MAEWKDTQTSRMKVTGLTFTVISFFHLNHEIKKKELRYIHLFEI